MRSFLDYVELAKKNAVRPSQNGVAMSLGMAQSSFNKLCTGKHIPSEETFLKIIDLAGAPYEEAMLDWSSWHVRNERSKSAFEKLSQMLSAAALSVMIFMPSDPAQAMGQGMNKAPGLTDEVYIMRITSLVRPL